MEEQNKIEKLAGHIREYVETRVDLAIINIQDKVSDILSSIASVVILLILLIFVLFFTSVGVAWSIGQRVNDLSMGFYYVAGFYLLAGIVIYISREKLIRLPIINALIKKININEED
jgi:uncharacterized membrane protein YqjE